MPETPIRLVPFDALLARMRAGDAAASGEFFRRYEPFMRSVARYWLSPGLRRHADSGDMVQSVFRIALQSLRTVSFSDEARVRSWLGTVMRNRIARIARRVGAPGGRALGDIDDVPEPADDGDPPPEVVAEHAELVHRLKVALDTLPEDERRAIRMREFEERDYSDVAAALGRTSADAARKLHDRALVRLSRLMAGAC